MKVIPAIDIKGGKVVRLAQGKAEHETVYFDSPLEAARMWAAQGAELIHVVDLDGAIDQKFDNLPLIKKMAGTIKSKIELGGGLRDEKMIKEVLDAGVEKIVVGTKALDEKFLSDIVNRFGDKIVLGIDAKDGYAYVKGWLSKSKLKVTDLVNRAVRVGVKTINYTDISRDGMLGGVNTGRVREILDSAAGVNVVAGGGVSTIDDIKRLKALEKYGLKGIIIGKALYEKTIDLKEAIKLCLQKE